MIVLKWYMEMNKKRLYRTIPAIILMLSVGAITTYAETTATTYRYIDGSSYTYSSQGILTITNEQDNSQSVVIDTNDIYANAAAIEDIQKKLTGLGGGNLGYDNTSNTYYIDIDGDGSLNEDSDVLIGAVGSATTDMVLEGYTFSSQEAGVNKSGTMTDVLSHNNVLTAGVYTPSGSDSVLADGSISLAEGGSTLSAGATDLSVGVGESVTLPSGYYSSDVTVGNGVVNRGTVNAILTSSDNTIKLPAGYYEESIITTNIKSLSGTITYTHHQCSNTQSGQTYTNTTTNASGAAAVNELTVDNGKVASKTKGGCYTTPCYYVKHAGTRCTAGCSALEYGHESGQYYPSGAPIWQAKSQCTAGHVFDDYGVARQYPGQYFGQCPVVSKESYAYHYDTNYKGTLVATYYIKTCGHTNGEIISATITY